MKRVIIIHGFHASPTGGWRPWLVQELQNKGIEAEALSMPSPDDPIFEEWLETIQKAVGEKYEDVCLVGHSLGVPAVLRFLEQVPEGKKIAGAVLVSGLYKPLRVEDTEGDIRKIDHFVDHPFDFEKIKSSCEKFVVIHGDNDDRVPFEHAEFLSGVLECKLIPIPNGGHLNGKSGCRELPSALESILEIAK
ncbi:MAG: alpha/beta hydrolase [Candidatus Paceibacterota bacterium]|jgi:hypothetical protein